MTSQIRTVVSDKPYPIPIEMRPLWRVSLIMISIYISSGKNDYIDLKKCNILVWMLVRETKWSDYEDFLLDRTKKSPLVSVDSATYKATELAIAKGYIKVLDSRLYITPLGIEFVKIIISNNIMTDEISFLERFSKKLTIKKIKNLIGGN